MLVLGVHVGTRPQQAPERLCRRGVRRQVQCRGAVRRRAAEQLVFLVELEQPPRRARVAAAARQVERARLAVTCARVKVRARAREHADDLGAAARRGDHQRARAVGVGGVEPR